MFLLLALYIFYHCLYFWLGRPHCICSEQISIGKRPNYFKPSGFPCYILNNTHFFWKQSPKSENLYGLRKVGTSRNKMVYPEGTFLWWGLFIPNFKTIAYVDYKRSEKSQNKPGYMKFKSKVLKQINPKNQTNDFFNRSLF